ncbi:hypothetical protein ACIRVK_38965 [Streptomyces sp. NPDC101152]|uniref:hypothetical protein n=1 Tax=Streptomyces sp. NPDC101152 TaxID=3366116 RepID=UPI00381300F8
MPWKTAFTSSWRAPSWHELIHGRAAGCSWVTGGMPAQGTRGRGPGRSRPGIKRLQYRAAVLDGFVAEIGLTFHPLQP